jgi:uncharacterized protein (TIGR03435 family)
MQLIRRGAIFSLFAVGIIYGQAPATEKFEVASVKRAAPPAVGQGTEVRGGPGTSDPGQITFTRIFLSQVFRRAFGSVWDFQLQGPSWLETEMYTINAKIPPGTTQEQFRLMLQNLLVERFGLKFHREQKSFPAYELVVANGGPKLKESEPGAAASPEQASRTPPKLDKDGFPMLPPGVDSLQSLTNGRNRVTMRTTMPQFAGQLERDTGRPVTDKTELTGKYDLKLDYSTEGLGGQRWVALAARAVAGSPNDGGPTLFNALQQQLGLKLEDRKEPFDVIVIDHVEKVPTED